MKKHNSLYIILLQIFILMLTSCSPPSLPSDSRSFTEAREVFETTLIRQNTNDYYIPDPPEGVFDLIYYKSTVGELAAYISCDPNDSREHPLIIWVAGGWSGAVSSLPWSYPEWENDQTGSAFRENGILVMYPSFRGANGNPGYHESMYGEIDDIAAAYEYAASLPYVDSGRIYLGGHSTGGTQSLLTAAYTDKFRAVFSFGPVDDIQYHRQTEFTFDIKDIEECKMRSPIVWLKDINTRTFIFEGKKGNSTRLRSIERNSGDNPNIHCYIVKGADHFDILAPITQLLAEKIKNDTTYEDCSITITMEEIENARRRTLTEPMPLMVPFRDKSAGLSMIIPAIWGWRLTNDESRIMFYSDKDEDNFWDTSIMFLAQYNIEEEMSYDAFVEMVDLSDDFTGREEIINGTAAFILEYLDTVGFNIIAAFQFEGNLTVFTFWIPKEYTDTGKNMFDMIINSIEFFYNNG